MALRRRRTVPATELRVHLGAALRALAEEDIVIEKGGVPVALLTAYRPAAAPEGGAETEYARSLSRAAAPGGWERMEAAMAAGWSGIEPEEMVANVYRWRAEGGMSPLRSLAATPENADASERAAETEMGDGSEVPPRQRYLYSSDPPTRLIADSNDSKYTV